MTLNDTASAAHSPTAGQSSLWALSLGSLGVVYGDIGTSPLYAFREAITSAGGSADGLAPNSGQRSTHPRS
jgi:KUP system potassium uptake protein